MQQNLPFKVGQMVESRSFSSGFRGAWFRSKIKGISKRKRNFEYSLEFIDFPDEKVYSTRVYQIQPVSKKNKKKEITRQLMVRPKYPLVCYKKEIPDANTVPEDTVAIIGDWKAGDYVDWWTDGCYWSGQVTEILDNGKAQVDLLPPPLGEGSSYQVDCKDLRLSLDWSLEFGWSVPILEREESCPTARLIKPLNLDAATGSHTNVDIDALEKAVENIEPISDQCLNMVSASSISPSLLIPEDIKDDPMIEEAVEGSSGGMEQVTEAVEGSSGGMEQVTEAFEGSSGGMEQVTEAVEGSSGGMEQVTEASEPMDIEDDCLYVKENCSDSVASSNNRIDVLAEKTEDDGETKEEEVRPAKEVSLNSMYSDTFDAAVMDLEELIIRIKWLKDMLECPQPTSNSNSSGSSLWEFVEHRA